MICKICKLNLSKKNFRRTDKFCRKCDAKKRREARPNYDETKKFKTLKKQGKKQCKLCKKIYSHKEFYTVGTSKDGNLRYQPNCKQCHKLEGNQYYQRYKPRLRISGRIRRRIYRKKYTEHCREMGRQYWKKNKKYLSATRQVIRLKLQRKIAKFYKEEIKQIILQRPQKHQVDHIIPINHPLITGLHVPWNMQYLTRSQNGSKKNSFDGTYENESWRERYAERFAE